MSALIQALANGQSPETILNFISNSSPTLAPTITKAKKYGFTPAKIVNFLANLLGEGDNVRGGTEAFQSNLGGQRAEQKLKDVAGLGLGLAGAFAARKAIPAIAQGIQGAFGNKQQSPPAGGPPPSAPPGPDQGPVPAPSSGIGPSPMSNAPVHPTPVPAAPQANVAVAAGAIPNQQPQQVAPQTQQQPAISPQKQRAEEFIRDLQAEEQVKELARLGRTPEQIASELQTNMHPSKRKSYNAKRIRGEEAPIHQHVKEFLTGPEGFLKEDVMKLGQEKPKEAKKGSIVATPEGVVGSIKDIKNKDALIESDGKLHKAKKEDAVPIPPELENRDFKAIAREYKSKFPATGPGSLSDNLSVVDYNPATKEFIAVFVTSPKKKYRFKNVPPELHQKIIAQETAPKTQGAGYFGGWSPDIADSRGSAFAEIRNNPEKYPFDIFEGSYNMLEPLMQAIADEQKEIQREHAKRKREEKKRNP